MIIVLIMRQIKELKSTHKGCVNRFYRLQWLWRFRVPLNIYLSFLYFMINSIPPTIHKHKKKPKHFWTGDWMKDHYSSTNGICMYKYQKNKSTSLGNIGDDKTSICITSLSLNFFFSCWIADETFLFAQAFVYSHLHLKFISLQ